MSVKSVTTIEGVDGLYSITFERVDSTLEATSPSEVNKSSDY